MVDNTHHQQQQHYQQNQNQSSTRMTLRNAGVGEIVEVQGGHIVRSTGRKDRHSKVCTAKGPRDRRVRLSAHTAIKFYDVQDRLGYDRPSKAVDWLIKNAKPAIDKLEQLPPWQPAAAANHPAHQVFDHGKQPEPDAQTHQQRQQQQGAGKKPVEAAEYGFQQHVGNPTAGNTSFLPPSLDSDAIADTLKSFFPVPSSSSSSSIHFQSCPPDLLSRTSSQSQDLRLSLQSFQDPLLLQHQHHHPTPSGEQALFTGSTPLAFDVPAPSASWSEQPQEMGRFQRMIAWSAAESSAGGGAGGGYILAAPPAMPLLAQNPFFSQRGPLQSSNSPAVRAWADPPPIAPVEHQLHQPSASSIPVVGFASGGFSGFRIPARIQGDEEQDAVAHKPSSVSSAPRH